MLYTSLFEVLTWAQKKHVPRCTNNPVMLCSCEKMKQSTRRCKQPQLRAAPIWTEGKQQSATSGCTPQIMFFYTVELFFFPTEKLCSITLTQRFGFVSVVPTRRRERLKTRLQVARESSTELLAAFTTVPQGTKWFPVTGKTTTENLYTTNWKIMLKLYILEQPLLVKG